MPWRDGERIDWDLSEDDMGSDGWENQFDPGIEYTDHDERFEQQHYPEPNSPNMDGPEDPQDIYYTEKQPVSQDRSERIKLARLTFEISDIIHNVKPISVLYLKEGGRVFLDVESSSVDKSIAVFNTNDKRIGYLSQQTCKKILEVVNQDFEYIATANKITREPDSVYTIYINIRYSFQNKSIQPIQGTSSNHGQTYKSDTQQSSKNNTASDQKTRKYGWGTIIGGAIGLMGGPIGAIIGATIGNYLENSTTEIQNSDKLDNFHSNNINTRIVEPQYHEHGQFYTKVVGVTYEGRQGLITQLRRGDNLFLQRERNNVHDANCIAIYDPCGRKIGFLSRELAAKMPPKMDRGWSYKATVSQVTGGGEYVYGINILVTY